jgi:hypothetical protein
MSPARANGDRTALARDEPQPAPSRVETAPARELAYWQDRGRYGDETVRSLATLVCGEGRLEALNARSSSASSPSCSSARSAAGSLGAHSTSWLAQLAHRDDRRTAAEALRARLVEKTNEVELGRTREARDEVDPTRDALQERRSQLLLVAHCNSARRWTFAAETSSLRE